jgi:hypothetical protein
MEFADIKRILFYLVLAVAFFGNSLVMLIATVGTYQVYGHWSVMGWIFIILGTIHLLFANRMASKALSEIHGRR